MTPQSKVIKAIDSESTRLALGNCGTSTFGAIICLARMIFMPMGSFVRSLLSGKGIVKGRAGVIYAINEWALAFVIEAKRYESINGDYQRAVEESRDFK